MKPVAHVCVDFMTGNEGLRELCAQLCTPGNNDSLRVIRLPRPVSVVRRTKIGSPTGKVRT